MAINYASKYAQKIDEKFARESMTSAAVNNDYDFVGVKTVNVYSVPTAEMNDYSVSGTYSNVKCGRCGTSKTNQRSGCA